MKPEWICPDCTTDLADVRKHPAGWAFCPFTGRPRGVLHWTPQRMRDHMDELERELAALPPAGAAVVFGVLEQWIAALPKDGPVSYLGGSRGRVTFAVAPENERHKAIGAELVAPLLQRTTEWGDRMADLSGVSGPRSATHRASYAASRRRTLALSASKPNKRKAVPK